MKNERLTSDLLILFHQNLLYENTHVRVHTPEKHASYSQCVGSRICLTLRGQGV